MVKKQCLTLFSSDFPNFLLPRALFSSNKQHVLNAYWVSDTILCFTQIKLLNPPNDYCGIGTVIFPILQMNKPRQKKVNYLSQDHIASKWQSWGLNPDGLAPEPAS